MSDTNLQIENLKAALRGLEAENRELKARNARQAGRLLDLAKAIETLRGRPRNLQKINAFKAGRDL